LLWLVFFGPLKEPENDGHRSVVDLDWREIATLAPIMSLCLFIGMYPQPVIDVATQDLNIVADIVNNQKNELMRTMR